MFNKKLFLIIYFFIFSISCNNGKDLNKEKSLVQKNIKTNSKLKDDKKTLKEYNIKSQSEICCLKKLRKE